MGLEIKILDLGDIELEASSWRPKMALRASAVT
jgi:hypothetical protein